ncbi:MAG: flavodoxin family protein [Humidesulfovibrio sp.]|nr:flavodoxin family protein [Humidesulfovibrio sp.]
MKVLAINGSARLGGNTAIMLNTALEELKLHGIATELVQLGPKGLQGCIACYKCIENKDKACAVDDDRLNGYIEKMLAADGILLGSPTYFADVTTNMKALMDRSGMVSRANADMFQRKVGAAVVTARRGGAIHTFDTLNHFFFIGQMIVPGSSYWNMGYGREPGQVSGDEEALATMRTLGQNMAWLMKKIAD